VVAKNAKVILPQSQVALSKLQLLIQSLSLETFHFLRVMFDNASKQRRIQLDVQMLYDGAHTNQLHLGLCVINMVADY